MHLGIRDLAELSERLARLRVEEAMAQALAEQAGRMAAAVQDALSEPGDVLGQRALGAHGAMDACTLLQHILRHKRPKSK